MAVLYDTMYTETHEPGASYISCEDLSFAYEGHTAVRGITFTVERGDYLCVVGENGSGKSTLIRGLLGLKKADRGRVLFGGGLRANEIGYLPQQEAPRKDFPAGVFEVVISGFLGSRGFRPFYSAADKQRAEQNLAILGIAELRKRCYRELSGGQQRRVLLARSLCAARKLLILDEPAAGLDPPATAELYRLLEKINRELGMTIIMVSHDIKSAVAYGNRILHLQKHQHFFGTPAEYGRSSFGLNFLAAGEEESHD
jgi:zinc transport system ATP-binding protein